MSTTSVLPFQLYFDKTDLRYTSYKTTITTTNGDVQTTETKKKEIPLIAAGASLHNILYCINEFFNAKKILQWTTGAKLFEVIEDNFEDPQDKTLWETLLATDTSRSVAQFGTFLQEYINYKFSEDSKAYRTHRRFLHSIKKTRTLTVHQFVSLVQYHNGTILPLLPGAPALAADASYSSDDIKDIIFNSMPEEWRDSFDLHLEIDDSTLPTLVKYMEKQKSISTRKNKNKDKPSQKDKKNDSDTSDDRNSSKRRNWKNGKGKGRGKDRNRNKQQGNGPRQQGRIHNSDPCPLPGHQGHNWGSCYQNINNLNANACNNNRDNQRDNHVNENANGRNSNGNNGNSNGNNSQQNPQQGDNYYCQFVNKELNGTDYSDLFHVDCKVEDNYFDDDLQQFPIIQGSQKNPEYEEIFATEKNSTEKQLIVSTEFWHVSPAPPKDSTRYVRLSKPKENEDLAPTTVIVCNKINDRIQKKHFFKTLFDSGSTDNIITKDSLPKNTECFQLSKQIEMRTARGTYLCNHYIILKNVMIPELLLTHRCKGFKCLVIESKMNYQLIIGRKCMKDIGLSMDFANSTINWYGKDMSFHPRNYFSNNGLLRKILSNEPYATAEAYANQSHTYHDATTKYEETDLPALVSEQDHLDDVAKKALLDVLNKHKILFVGLTGRMLGIFPNREYHIDLIHIAHNLSTCNS